MRITSVGMYSSRYSEALDFSLTNADYEARYIARNIVGLDADEIIPKFYGYGIASNTKFYDFGMKARDIVIRIVLNPHFDLGETYSDIRDELYRSISANRTGVTSLLFRSGATTVAKIDGMITKFEVGYFNQLPEVQLTIKCNDPIFKGINPVSYDAADLINFSNPMIIADSLSTAPHGFVMELLILKTTPSITIQDVQTNPEWTFTVTPPAGFSANDRVYFSSESADKYLYMVRAGVTTHLIDVINPNGIWPIIFPGGNSLYFVQDAATVSKQKLEFYPAYWGV